MERQEGTQPPPPPPPSLPLPIPLPPPPPPPMAMQPKIPTLSMFSREGDDLKPDVLGRWLQEVKRYFPRYNMTDIISNITLGYGDYTTGRPNDAIIGWIDEHGEGGE